MKTISASVVVVVVVDDDDDDDDDDDNDGDDDDDNNRPQCESRDFETIRTLATTTFHLKYLTSTCSQSIFIC